MEKVTKVEDSVWASQLKEALEKQTGRSDIEVTVTPYRRYDSLVSASKADKHPIVDFYSEIQGDPARVKVAFDYAAEMIQNWEATHVWHEKAKKDCLPFFESLKEEFPHLKLVYTVFEYVSHFVHVEKLEDQIGASFDLWPMMTESDIKRVSSYIRDFEDTLKRENATVAGATYSWK